VVVSMPTKKVAKNGGTWRSRPALLPCLGGPYVCGEVKPSNLRWSSMPPLWAIAGRSW
jgi:hypothetical protein